MFRGFSPYLYYEDAGAALDWLAATFGFEERARFVDADGVVQEAEMVAGDTVVMLTGMGPGYWSTQDAPAPAGHICIVYVDDVDAHYARATAAGAQAEPPQDKPYGPRVYQVQDIGGHMWNFWQHRTVPVTLPDGWQEIRAGTDGTAA